MAVMPTKLYCIGCKYGYKLEKRWDLGARLSSSLYL